MRFLFTCGGTAGHIYPAVGVAEKLKELMPDSEFLFVGAEGMMETELVPREGYDIKTVKITNIHRSLKPKEIAHNIATVKNVFAATRQAKRIIREFKPDAAIGTGGYVCYPVLKAAHALGIPTLVHESNAVPGLTTKLLAGTVDRVMVGFEEAVKNYKPGVKVEVTGTPVRSEFVGADRTAARKKLGLDDERPLVLSVWGSLGSAHMNGIMTGVIGLAAREKQLYIVHSAGKKRYDSMKAALEATAPDYEAAGMEVEPYLFNIPELMAASDLILCRSGASTLAELAALGRPAILVPSPNVTGNHQEKNARVLEKRGAALVLLEGEFNSESFYAEVKKLAFDHARLEQMSEAMRSQCLSNPAGRIAELILSLTK